VVDRAQKIDFLMKLDVLSVPTVYRDPKGLFVLEALAAGVPVVQPEHGAFPELLAQTGGGRLVHPNDPPALADALHEMLSDPELRRRLAREGQHTVHDRFHADAMAARTLEQLAPFLPEHQPAPSTHP
jgi:glycosyltransferase involved in cell wall biosynthesis